MKYFGLNWNWKYWKWYTVESQAAVINKINLAL